MTTQSPTTDTTSCGYAAVPGESQDSDDESSQEDHIPVSWEDLPIMERLGLTSGTDMTEEEVESAFTQLALAFNCDQYTLSQRRQAEEHERLVAQENLQLEVENSTKTLQTLKGRCMGSEWSDILGQMESSLNTVLAGMDDIISAAETLGAVHQEARAACAVELMQIHMEHLKRRHITESAELLATKKLFHRSRGRIHSDSDDTDMRSLFVRQGSQQHLIRRRVSVTLIPTPTQLSDLEAKFREGCQRNDDTNSQEQEEGTVTQDTRQVEVDSYASGSSPLLRLNCTQSCQSQEDEGEAVYPSPPQAALRHRRRLAILEQEGSTEEATDQDSPPGYEVSGVGDSDTSEVPPQAALRHRRRLAILEQEGSTEEATDQDSPPGYEVSGVGDSDASEDLAMSEQQFLSPWLPCLCGVLVLVIFLLCFLLLPGLLLTGLKSSRHHGTGTTAT